MVGEGLHYDLIIENKHYDIFWSISCAIKGYENGNIFYITHGEFTKFFDQCPFYLSYKSKIQELYHSFSRSFLFHLNKIVYEWNLISN